MADVTWRRLHDLKLGGLADYVDVWEKTNKKIDDNVADANSVVEPGVNKAFGDIAGSDMYSAGAEAAKKQLSKLTGQLDDAKAEGAAIADVVRGAKEDFKRIRDEFRDKVDEINGTTPGIDGAGTFTVDLDNELVDLPTKPSGERWNHQTAIDEWHNAYGPQADKFAEELDELILDAEDADERATLLLKETSGDSDEPRFNGDPPEDLDPEVIGDGLPPKDATPEEVKDWWDSLSDDEQQYFIEHEPGKVGDLDGIPIDARDEANRIYVDERPAQIDKELKELEDDLKDASYSEYEKIVEKIRELEEEKEFLGQVTDCIATSADNGQKHYLIDVDAKESQAVISTGNPDTADNTAVYVPGTDSSLDIGYQVGRSDTLQNASASADPNAETASVMWLGYDAPMNGGAVSWVPAENGAPELNNFMSSMRATHEGPPSHTTVIGHSYGSTVVGTADTLGSGLGADDVVAIGSPGMGYNNDNDGVVTYAQEMNTDASNVWTAEAEDDIVGDLGWHGPDPDDTEFGGKNLYSDTQGHSGYWAEGSTSLKNQANIITGKYDEVKLE